MNEKKLFLRGFVIPPGYRKIVKWVNDTPHLSARAANLHRKTLPKLGKNVDFSGDVYEWLSKARVKGADKAYALFKQLGPRGTLDYLVRLNIAGTASAKFLAKMVMEDEDRWRMDPTLSEKTYPDVARLLHGLIQKIEHPTLKKFEAKAFLKYAGDATRRNFDEYVRQVRENYLPERKAFANSSLPNLDAYDWALSIQYSMFISGDRSLDRILELGDFLASARRDTFGGAPYYKNMADYVNDDLDDLTSYADLYDELSLLWLFLPPSLKEEVSAQYTYSALERVQPGGLSSYVGTEDELSDFKTTQNKQRFVQAESAIFPRAMKAIHDLMRDVWKKYRVLASDKYSEEEVTLNMKLLAKQAIDEKMFLQGADYSNFDASIEIATLNDDYFNLIRANVPAWFVYYIIDPYYKVAFKTRIFIPGIGLVITTGIKSGMVITNQGDCYHANFCDLYEIARFMQTRKVDPWSILTSI